MQDESTLVIASHYDKHLLRGLLSPWWKQDRMRIGLEGWSFAHTYLTLLATNGVYPKVMQELAGDYRLQISMDIYTHVNMDAKREAV